MARKINLKALFNNGDLNVTTTSVTETGDSNGINAIFDNNLNTLYKFNHAVFPSPQVTLTFNKNIFTSRVFVKITTATSNIIWLNVNNAPTINNQVALDSNGDTVNFDFSNLKGLNSINILFASSADTTHTVKQLELYVLEESDPYEFNDSVLTTKAWNSSRYTGKQLQGAKINKYTSGDVSYANTPVIENHSRNIYLATEIVSLSKTGSAIEDNSLQYIPNFSYILVDKIITVNGDDTLTQVSLNSISNDEELKGINREFQSNIPIGSTIGFNNFDESIKNRSNQKYTVYFNRGRLQPILRFTGNPNISASGRPTITSNTLSLWSAVTLNGEADGIFTPRNEKLIQDFYSGSIDTLFKGLAQTSSMNRFFNQLLDYKEASNQKYFITVLNTSGSNFETSETTEPIRTITTDAINNVVLGRSRNLAEISTTEIMGYDGTAQIQLDDKHKLNRLYSPGGTQGDIEYYSGSFDISALNEEKLSLLINMNKETEFPDGKGSNPVVIVPENIHPYVKDNLVHFLIKAGINIGDRKEKPEIDKNRKDFAKISQQRLTPEQLRERAAQRRAEFEKRREEALNQTLRGRIQLKREENAEKRNEKRLEREQNREERKQKRQETRQDRFEDRQDRRENRRNRRRNR